MQGGAGKIPGSYLHKGKTKGGNMDLEKIVRTALAAGTREKARELVAAEVENIRKKEPRRDPAEVKRTLLSNIGYIAGYEDPTTADRIYELFDTEHPVFGRRHPTGEEALARGMLRGYLTSGRASQAGQKAVQAFADREDWSGLIEWMTQEGAKRNQLTVNE
jgi:hypothetical protein